MRSCQFYSYRTTDQFRFNVSHLFGLSLYLQLTHIDFHCVGIRSLSYDLHLPNSWTYSFIKTSLLARGKALLPKQTPQFSSKCGVLEGMWRREGRRGAADL